jgi:hypothetical protein
MRFALLLLLAGLNAASAQALAVRARTSTPPEMGTLHFLELTRDGHTYTVVPPGRDWPVKLDAPNARLQFSAPTGTVSFALRFTTNAMRDVSASPDALRRHATPELGDARPLAELEIFSGDAAGRAADFSYVLLGHPRRCRVAALPVPGGTVDFVLHSSVEEFPAAQQAIGAMVNTFQRTSRTAAEKAAAAEQKLAARETRISGD